MSNDAEKGSYRTPEGRKTFEYTALVVTAFLAGSIGCVVGWNSPSIIKLLADDSPIKTTPSDVSTMVAAMNIGHTVAPPLNIFLADQIGRRYTMIFASVPVVLSWGLITIATTVWELHAARFLAGFALGLFACVGPMYIGEVSSLQTRGIGGSLIAFMFNTGILITFIVAPYLSISLMAGIFLGTTIVLTLLFWFMPESPYFLAMRNRTEEAEEVLEKLRGKTDVSEELEAVVNSLANKGQPITKIGSLKDVFCVKGNLRALFIITCFSATHHFGGFYPILIYGRLLFQSASDSISDYTMTVLLGVMQLISSLLTAAVVERIGRRPLVLGTGIAVTLCNLVIGFFFLAKDYLGVDVSSYSWTPFIAALLMVFTFNVGFMCVQMVVTSEIFATEVKAVSTCLVSISSGLLGSFATKFYIWVAITMAFGHGPLYVLFGIVMLILSIVIYVSSPETRGKTFAEIQRDLNS